MSEVRRYMALGATEIHYLTWAVLGAYGTFCGLEGEKAKRTFSATSEEELVNCKTCKAKLDEANAAEAAARLNGTHQGKG